MKLINGRNGKYAFGFEYSVKDGFNQVGHDGGNRVKIRHYFKSVPNEDSFTIAYLTNGNANNVWTDILTDSLMSIIDPKQFRMASLNEQFVSLVLNEDKQNLNIFYERLFNAFDGEESTIERFILYNSYGVRYGSGARASLPAFELLTSKFPNSSNAWDSLAEIWQSIGDKEKAIEYYKAALASVHP